MTADLSPWLTDCDRSTKKSAPQCSGALFCCATNALINNFNKVRLARADHVLGVRKAVHVNCDPTSVYEHEVRIPDQSEMARPISLNEELFRVPSKTEHFGVTRSELVLVHSRRLVRARHVSLARARTSVVVWLMAMNGNANAAIAVST